MLVSALAEIYDAYPRCDAAEIGGFAHNGERITLLDSV